jgi:hypothetical protein
MSLDVHHRLFRRWGWSGRSLIKIVRISCYWKLLLSPELFSQFLVIVHSNISVRKLSFNSLTKIFIKTETKFNRIC